MSEDTAVEVTPQPVSVRRLTREDILSCRDLTEKEVNVPEWGGSVVIRSFSKRRQQELRKLSQLPNGEVDSERMEVLLFIEGVVDPEFTKEDYEFLREKSAGVVDNVVKEILTLSGLTPGVVDEATATFHEG